MPEISLNLLKEKIIKTDTVITLLADKNEKISQLREKLKLLYHKYVNRLKECEVLQLKIDLCKLEHEPLQVNFKIISEKYQGLQAEHENLTNVSEIRYQTKCKELELQMKKYETLILQKEQCKSCQEVNAKYESACRKYEKISKQFNKLTEKYKEEQEDIKNTFSKFHQTEKDYVNQLKCLKENHAKEILKVQEKTASIQLSKQKLDEEIIYLNNKIDLSTSQGIQNYQASKYTEDLTVNNFTNEENVNTCTKIINRSGDEFQYILNEFCDSIPALLSPLSEDLILDQVDENVQESSELCNNLSTDAALSDIVSLFNNSHDQIIEIEENSSCRSEGTTPSFGSDFDILNQSLISNFSDENSDIIANLEVFNHDTVITQTYSNSNKKDGANRLAIDNSNTAGADTSSRTSNIVNTSSHTIKNPEEIGSVESNVKVQTAGEQECISAIISNNTNKDYRGIYLDSTNSLKTIIDLHRESVKYISLFSSNDDLLGFSVNNENIKSSDAIEEYKLQESLFDKIDENITTSCEENNLDNASQKSNESQNTTISSVNNENIISSNAVNETSCEANNLDNARQKSNELENTTISEGSIYKKIDSDSLTHPQLSISNEIFCNDKLNEDLCHESIAIENTEKDIAENTGLPEKIDLLPEELILSNNNHKCSEIISKDNENEVQSNPGCRSNTENAYIGKCSDFISSNSTLQEHFISSINTVDIVNSSCNNLESKSNTDDNNLLEKKSIKLNLQQVQNSIVEIDSLKKTSMISQIVINNISSITPDNNDSQTFDKSNSSSQELFVSGNALSCDVKIFKKNSLEDFNTNLNADTNLCEKSIECISLVCDVAHEELATNEISKADFELCNKLESVISTKRTTEIKEPFEDSPLNISEVEKCSNPTDERICDGYIPIDNSEINVIRKNYNCKSNNDVDGGNFNSSCNNVQNVHEGTNYEKESFECATKYYNDNIADIVDKIIFCRKESTKYIYRTVLGNDILGFTKEPEKHVQHHKKKIIRRSKFLYKMKQELFNSLVRYFNKRIKLNSPPNFSKKRTKCHSSKFKNIRKQQMLRWRRFRELYLPSTDTDSDYSKKFIYTKRKVRNKSQAQQNVIESKSKNQVSSISDDEHMIREIFKEERNYQALIPNHKALEDFYHMSTDVEDNLKFNTNETNTILKPIDESNRPSNTTSKLSVSKDDSNSDSGYVKSDLDYTTINKINRRKRTYNNKESLEKSVSKRKCILMNDQDSKICDVNLEINNLNDLEKKRVQSNLIEEVSSIVSEQNTFVTKGLDIIERDSLGGHSISINSKATETKKSITPEICALLQSESVATNEVIADCSLIEDDIDLAESHKNSNEKINDAQYLFGSDCESVCSDYEENSISNTVINNEKAYLCKKQDTTHRKKSDIYSQRSNTKHNKKKIEKETLNLKTTKSSCLEVNNSANNCHKNNFTEIKSVPKHSGTNLSKMKSTAVDDKRKIKLRNREIDLRKEPEEISKTHAVSPENDPLHIRLKQENQLRISRDNNSNNSVQTSYKRSNALKKQVKFLDLPTNPLDVIEVQSTETVEKCQVSLKKRLSQVKARMLLKKLLTFPDRAYISDEVAEAFSGQEHRHIFRIIIHELTLDVSKPDTKYTPPAPVLTETQRILLGLLVKLDRTTSTGLLESFMLEAEKYLLLLTADKMHMLERVARLYLAICKLQRKIHRMRRMVCDSFYFMGDLSVPFLFTVLSTWTEVMPFETELCDEPLIKVIIEILMKKTCISPGYNLNTLNKLLSVYYGYAMKESNVEETFLQIFNAYIETQTVKLEYAMLILCKNLPKSWVLEKIQLHMKPIIESGTDITLKMNITTLIRRITREYNSVEINKLITFDKVPD